LLFESNTITATAEHVCEKVTSHSRRWEGMSLRIRKTTDAKRAGARRKIDPRRAATVADARSLMDQHRSGTLAPAIDARDAVGE
jgi:hypothetical protein